MLLTVEMTGGACVLVVLMSSRSIAASAAYQVRRRSRGLCSG